VVVKTLLDQDDVPVDWKNHWRETALAKAVSFGQENVVAMLLGRANPNIKDCNGDSPLSSAAFHGDETMVRLLLSADSISVNSRNKRGQTPLLQAAQVANVEIVKLLMAHGARINDRDKERRTPLSYAAEWGNASTVKGRCYSLPPPQITPPTPMANASHPRHLHQQNSVCT
jgi:ankyrin repeat protein